MTRINLVPVELLEDSHLTAEHRELTRIPNNVPKGTPPDSFVLGTGHMTFFKNKIAWLYNRYDQLHKETKRRGFNFAWRWPERIFPPHILTVEWSPSINEIEISAQRIILRLETKKRGLRYYRKPCSYWQIAQPLLEYCHQQ